MFLEKMITLKKEEINRRNTPSSLREMKERVSDLPSPRSLVESILKNGPMALIAEIKQASPSAGWIREDADLGRIACAYQAGGASAVSVLTEAHFFEGALSHLRLVGEAVSLPVLQKDFIIDPFQIYEGRVAGADAILLIAAILEPRQLREFAELARDLGLVSLVEIHDEEDLEKISGLDLPLIGINNRNLKTLQVDLKTTFGLIGKVRPGAIIISESGIRDRDDVIRLQKTGVKGILVGEVLMRSPDPSSRIRELLGLNSGE
jgi:indole-3-glycerol phosphate synthase